MLADLGRRQSAAPGQQQQQQQQQQARRRLAPGTFLLAARRRAGRAASLAARASAGDDADAPPRRVVVTGLGVVSPLGNEHDEFYGNLLEGRSGIAEIESFDASGFSTRFAGEVKHMDTDGYINKKMERRLDRTIKFVLLAGKKAMGDAGLPWDSPSLKSDLDLMRCGTVVGSAFGGMNTFATAVEVLETQGYKKMNPFCIPFAITNMAGALLAMDTGFMGPNYSINTACASGNYCIHNAAGHIARGEADVMLAGSADASVLPSGMGGFIACKALSKRNDDPAGASRPWDRDRDGFVMGEGAGVLVLEDYEHAKGRGARIYAEYAGGAFTCDAHHMTEPHPDGRGVRLCIERAVAAAGLAPEQVTYVNAHATSTPAGDMAEYRAIRAALPHAGLRMNSTKSMIGHLLGGAGAVEAIATVKAIQTGWLHPTLNCASPEDGVDLDVICSGGKQARAVDVALSNSFGFGGHNSAIIFKSFKA